MVRVKALTDNVTTLNATLMENQIGECPPDRAKVLAAKGHVEILGEGDVEATKGDRTERAVSPAAKAAETQTKKG
jgi:hypothetical protein